MSPRRRPRSGDDGGWVLVTSIMMLAMMLVISASVLSITNVQMGQARVQRVRETAFNLAEAGLNGQIFSLARDWPGAGAAANPYPVCSGSVSSSRCPTTSQITSLIPSADATGATWQTVVRDNGTPGTASFYSDALVLAQPAYDANKDGQLWVRATATAQGKSRTVVALVRADQQDEDIPHAALITGRLSISNMGNKTIIDASAGAGVATATVRCVPAPNETTACLGHPVGQPPIGNTVADLASYLGKQLTPNVTTTGYAGGPAMTPEARARLKATAIADGTYFTGCPPTLTGHVVYIEAGNCSYTGNSVFNSATDPGMVLMATGTLYLGGTTVFNGVLYHANLANDTGPVLQLQGNTNVIGGVLVDGDGQTIAGSSKVNIQLSQSAFRAVKSYGSAGIIQNTWREIRGS
ncbi:hypothetical protein NBH00_07580 [Paraconexibacter antarcticus]|uniref:Type 4 fimbrial biogenesis protein PilX N-terminal domain-containing protein n=1 Tax=Paraconexibacter antarcticus TaxID=2949664 RepID=A0ABY5DX22_9ACTN|nr:hypothetical protein [Paraconexibacter antarcticus]UTI66055.1 hypothetical protein NBH00_07580 [Paraconexibacter antarcticus]